MTRTGRALAIGLLGVLLAFSTTAVGVAQDGLPRDVANPSESPFLGGPRASATGMWPALTAILEPVALAALCGTALALFSAGPRPSPRARSRRRK